MPNRLFDLVPSGVAWDRSAYDAQILLVWQEREETSWDELLTEASVGPDRDRIVTLARRMQTKATPGTLVVFDRHLQQRWVLWVLSATQDMFKLLQSCRQVMKNLKDARCHQILADLHQVPLEHIADVTDALVAACKAQLFEAPQYRRVAETPTESAFTPHLRLLVPDTCDREELEQRALAAERRGSCGNRVRYLVMQAGNDLTPKNFVKRLRQEAKKLGLGFEFLSQSKLEDLKAGAFLAVCQGSSHQDAGIVHMSYEPPRAEGALHISLVGKGITFDTGGTNLKPASSMWGMHRDMAGSAVAYALVRLASLEQWPCRVSAWLAIAENAHGPESYRQNDVVTAMNGKTIEIVHTDAEGRMVLADTLYLATQEKPDLVLDFATLTGACVGAIGTQYSGAFTNRPAFIPSLIAAGKASGERVWPFPLDDDFAECLKSDIADTKQCRLSGGVDHIEAAIFLKGFLASDVPWVHVDLSAAENTGGLAHVETETTGFGVRFAAQLIQDLLPSLGGS